MVSKKLLMRRATALAGAFCLGFVSFWGPWASVASAAAAAAEATAAAAEVAAASEVLAGGGWAVVAEDVVNLRSGPGTSNPRVGQARRGDKLQVLGEANGWLKVRTAQEREAWVAAFLVKRQDAPAPPRGGGAPAPQFSGPPLQPVPDNELLIAQPATDGLNLRSGPGVNYASAGKAALHQRFPVEARAGDWLQVRLSSGETAWMAGWLTTTRRVTRADFAANVNWGAVAAGDNVPLLGQPIAGFDALTRVARGTKLQLLDARDGFWNVRLPNGTAGWMAGKDVKVYNLTAFEESVDYAVREGVWEIRQLDIGTPTDRLNVRPSAGTSGAPLGQLAPGTAVKIRQRSGAWLQVSAANGLAGWVHGDYVKLRKPAPVEAVRVEEATPQSKVLSVSGDFATPALVRELEGGRSLAIYLEAGANPGLLALNSRELGALSVNSKGVLLTFQERPQYRIVQNAPGSIKIELQAAVTGARLERGQRRDVLTLDTAGFVDPSAVWDGAGKQLVLRLPHTELRGTAPALSGGAVRGVTFKREGRDLVVQVAAPSLDGRYLVRREANRIQVELLQPGLAGKTVVLDPGHGGYDPGARGAAGVTEKVVNLQIALKLKERLEAAGATVIMTRTGDTAVAPADKISRLSGHERTVRDLSARSDLANAKRADVFISVHNNAGGGTSGTTTYYAGGNFNVERSKAVAQSLHQSLVAALGRPDRGVKSEEFFVVRNVQSPAVLLEILYLTNAEEERLLSQAATQDRVADAVLKGLQRFYQ